MFSFHDYLIPIDFEDKSQYFFIIQLDWEIVTGKSFVPGTSFIFWRFVY